jgi:hypothetical protein
MLKTCGQTGGHSSKNNSNLAFSTKSFQHFQHTELLKTEFSQKNKTCENRKNRQTICETEWLSSK